MGTLSRHHFSKRSLSTRAKLGLPVGKKKAPTNTGWNLGNLEFVPSRTYSDKAWFRGDEGPIENFGDLGELTWYDERAQSTAYKLLKEIHSLQDLADDDFFVVNPSPKASAGGNPSLKSLLK